MRVAVAQDEAFNFIYPQNLASLGTVICFSPMRDKHIFDGVDMLYLPGGYPELFAEELTANVAMRKAILDFAEQGGRILAECGGFMYLCQSIDEHPMVGVFPFHATMQGARLHLGYRSLELPKGVLHGHEFHYSSLCDAPDQLIYKYKNVRAGYTHWYWADGKTDLLCSLFDQ